MSQLPVSGVVNVSVSLTPLAAATRSFGSLLILGASDVIDTTERIRQYSSITDVANDFGTSAPEYKAAALYLSQSPKPAVLYIGRWAQVATAARLKGGALSTAQQDMDNFTSITTGSMKITIDGVLKSITSLDMSSATNLNGVAALLTTKLSTAGTATWNSVYKRFEIKSATTGTSSTISYAEANVSGVDVSALFGLTDDIASAPVNGLGAETLLSAVSTLADQSTRWYGLTVAASIATDEDVLAVSEFIEAAEPSRIFGHTVATSATLDGSSTTDLAYKLKAAGYRRTLVQYSSSSVYAVNSLLGRAFSVNFLGNNTTITLKFKREPGVTPEQLTTTQAAVLTAKNANVFVEYNNDTTILQEGKMCDGSFIDEVHGLDWFQNDVQTAIWNLLYTSGTKVPQTNPGINRISAVIERRCEQAVSNGLAAPGVWGGDSFGVLQQGDYLSKGYYVY